MSNTIQDIAVICTNGHVINPALKMKPEGGDVEFCKDCGEKTIRKCPHCNTDIGGGILVQNVQRGKRPSYSLVKQYHAPSYCEKCGEAYPWTESKIKAAIDIFLEFGDLDGKQKETIEEDITNLAKNAPETELSAMRIKRIWDSTPVAIARESIMEFCSRTAAKVLNGG